MPLNSSSRHSPHAIPSTIFEVISFQCMSGAGKSSARFSVTWPSAPRTELRLGRGRAALRPEQAQLFTRQYNTFSLPSPRLPAHAQLHRNDTAPRKCSDKSTEGFVTVLCFIFFLGRTFSRYRPHRRRHHLARSDFAKRVFEVLVLNQSRELDRVAVWSGWIPLRSLSVRACKYKHAIRHNQA